jgi:hypothetical protein
MSQRPIIDAGPGLNFLSIHKERLLISVLGQLSAPEIVEEEVFRKSRQDQRFRDAQKIWRKLTPKWMLILPDDQTPELAAVVHRIGGLPIQERLKHPKDLGETMVIAHAVVAAEAGDDVTVLIDDGPGARIATSEINRLQRRRVSGHAVGTVRLVNTLTVLERAAGKEYLPNKAAMRDTYMRLRGLDDGLPPIEATNLMLPTLWVR